MEAKCDFCEFFGEKKHCHNCKVFNGSRLYVPVEIQDSLEVLMDNIVNKNPKEFYNVGDYKNIELYTGEKVKFILLDFDKDTLEGGGVAKTTFGVFGMDGFYSMEDRDLVALDWGASAMRSEKLPRIARLLPKIIYDNAKTVKKAVITSNGETQVSDKFFLFSSSEVFQPYRYAQGAEGEQYEYFMNKDNLSMFKKNTWLRSAYKSGWSACYSCVDDGHKEYYSNAKYTKTVSYGLCLG